MSSSSNTASGGIGLGGAIFIVFLVLKLTGTNPVAAWSWWWVTSPLWIEVGAVAKRGDRYQLLPEPREPSAPRRSRRWVEHRLYIPARYRGAP